MPRYSYGGQALIEGVLMRGRDAIAVALRHPDGRIVYATERLDCGFHGSRWAKLPFLRGLDRPVRDPVRRHPLARPERVAPGRRARGEEGDEGVELGKGSIALMLGLTLLAGVGIFFLLPLLIASATTSNIENGLVQHLVEGLIRVGIFLGYLLLIAQAEDVRRVFQYHGAEHMTIHALEAGDPLVVDEVRKYPTAHPRCGTEFLVVVIALSIVAFSLVGRQEPLVMIGSRIALIPVIAAVGYEILKWGAKHRGNAVVRAIMYPGILVQKITTRQPTDDMIEVAIVSMEQALQADGEPLPAGSGTLRARRRWTLPGERPRRAPARRRRRAGHDRSAAPGSMSGDADRHRSRRPPRARSSASTTDVQAELATPEVSTDPDGSGRSARSCPGSSPSSRPSARSRRPAPSWPARARCATAATRDPEMKAMVADEIERLTADEDAAPRGAQGPPPAARPERRPRRDPRDPGRRRRRRGRPVRRGALPDVRPLRGAPPVHARSCSASTRPASAGSRRRSSRSTATAPTAA